MKAEQKYRDMFYEFISQGSSYGHFLDVRWQQLVTDDFTKNDVVKNFSKETEPIIEHYSKVSLYVVMEVLQDSPKEEMDFSSLWDKVLAYLPHYENEMKRLCPDEPFNLTFFDYVNMGICQQMECHGIAFRQLMNSFQSFVQARHLSEGLPHKVEVKFGKKKL